jgi:hypothetical protein
MKVLIIVGAIVIGLAAVVWYLVRKFNRLLNPPLRVHLVPEITKPRRSKKEIERFKLELESHGFDEIGTFRITEIPGLVVVGFSQLHMNVCAVVYDHPLVGCFLDVYSEDEFGNSLTVSNAPAGGELDQPPGREKVIDKTLTAPDMYDLLLRDRPAGPHKRFDSANFVDEYQAAYAREMDWRVNRGGVTDDEVRRSAEAIGVESEKAILRTAEKLQQHYADARRILPCESDAAGACPFEYDMRPDRDIEGMPFDEEDPRSCPKYGHVCPHFMEDFGLTPADLDIRASIHCGEIIDELVKKGVLEKGSAEYRAQKHRYENTRRMYPREKFPQYY